MVQAHAVGDRDENLERRVAGAGAHPGERRVDPGCAVFQRGNRVRNPEGQVVMGVDSGLGFRLQDVVERLETVGNVAHQQAPPESVT